MKAPNPDSRVAARYRTLGHWRDKLIDSFIEDVAINSPDRTVAIEADRRLTYGQLSAYVSRFAQRLISAGVSKGDVISFQLPNWLEALVVHMGAIRAGAISNPIVPIYRERELRHILSESDCRIAVIPTRYRDFDFEDMYASLQNEMSSLQHVWTVNPTDNDSLDRLAGASDQRHASFPDRSGDDPAVLLYTSGTTAAPKGVVHSHNTLDYENRTIIDLFGLGPDDVVFMPSPVTHITGVLYGLHLPTMLGSHVVLQDKWDPTRALELVDREGCTFSVAATPFLHAMTFHPELESYDLSTLRIFACGGADVAPDLVIASDRLLDCTVVRVYGSTEYPTLSCSRPTASQEKRAFTDGRRIGDAEAKIVDDKHEEVSPGTTGELIVKGPEMFLGYFSESVRPFDQDGWFATGDLASEDDDGYISIQGRKKDVILRGGENISAREVEDLLFEHPAIHEVAVVAVPDPVLTERACAVVVLEQGAMITLEDIARHLENHRIAKQKFPEYLQIVTELPKTASGKVQKFVLRDRYRGLADTRVEN